MPAARSKRAPRERWETVAVDTDRLPVPGGWIYRTVKKGVGVATCFVPQAARGNPGQLQAAGKAARELKQKLEQLKKLLDQAAAVRYLKRAQTKGRVH